MTIDPRWSVWLSISLAILGFLSGASTQFADLGMSPAAVKAILALSTLLIGLGNSLNAVLAAIPSKSDSKSLEKFYLGPKTEVPPPESQPQGPKP